MRKSMRLVVTAQALIAGLILSGCGQSDDATPEGQPPASASAPATPTDQTALVAAVVQKVKADSEVCFVPDGQAVETSVVDLGGGATGVVVLCSLGKNSWYRLYVRPAGATEATLQPMRWYDMPGDDQWHDETELPDLVWDAETKTFSASVSGGGASCGSSGQWRWTGSRMALIQMKRDDCSPEQPGQTFWPTTPATPEPAAMPKSEG